MSVAFRREDDDEHKEPRFELPLPPGPNLVTRRGLAAMAEQVARLEHDLAAESNAERQTALKRDLRYWRTRHSTAEIAPPPTDEVAFGSRVTYRLNGQQKTIELVGSDEADPAAGRVAFTAPLAVALTGLMAGETADFAGRADAIEVIDSQAIEP
ncbi:nucleoside diphosphate kinase [Sphingomonas sp. Leaf407]|uniref:GreA/GreB family elongation factor n=1 Tax=unclassified Sphingomonas TaxID=196159 RepID=UPI0006FC9D2A|nr:MULTISPECIES: GreA/GreB family elongation factor [unclassified Sphingomonas]KQN34825.1 nucleoside diphosphate kinase [Sphingomonas sp. Leaf42]KQT25377.1 nucleoside diphosphate kinase [Sphingomonas sp. Leaf407]